MKNFLVSFLVCSLSVLLISCESTEDGWNKLSQQEKEEILLQAQNKCLVDYSSTYTRFKNLSNDLFNQGSSYVRGTGFYHEYLVGKEVKRKVDIRVWKKDSNNRAIYFYVTETLLGTESYFLKISETENTDMISDLLTDHCAKKALIVTAGSSGPAKAVSEYEVSNPPNTDRYKDSFTYQFNNLAYFANFRLARNVKTVNSSGGTVGTPVDYTSTLINKNITFSNDAYNAKNNQGNFIYSQKFCTIREEVTSPASYRVSKESNTFGYRFKPDADDSSKLCDDALPVDWNLAF